MFDNARAPDRLISLHVSGTNCQISIWQALLQIPPNKVMSYAPVAGAIGNPKAARTVGLAVCQPHRAHHPLPPGHPAKRQARRLSLGRDPQTGDTRLGSGEI